MNNAINYQQQIDELVNLKTPLKRSFGHGLNLKIYDSGNAVWIYRYTYRRKRKEILIGEAFVTAKNLVKLSNCGKLTYEDALLKALEMRRDLKNDRIDPKVAAIKKAKPLETLNDVANHYFEKGSKKFKHPKIPIRLYDKYVKNTIGRFQIQDITAPYSGGKSSLINTYMRQRQNFNYVTISLASFKSIEQSVGVEGSKAEEKTDNNNLVDITKIEKSILQQILYRSDRKDTPNSRFRRIFPTPLSDKTAAFYSSSLLIWISLLSVYLDDFNLSNLIRSLSENELSLTGMLDSITSLNLWAFSYLISVPFLLFRDAIKPLGQYTITKINPLKGDVAFSSKSNDSVFNKYLEEIIYFFEAQKTDIVIFEDLDRFNNSDIFEKLKELNKLINDSNDVKQSVRFVYALKDDVFTGSNRTRNFNRPPIII
jgi:hypothetical protein